MKREIWAAALLWMSLGSIAPVWANEPSNGSATADAALKQNISDRDAERLERHREWEEEQQERREDERDEAEDREDDSRWDDRNDSRWDDRYDSGDRWDDRYDSRDDDRYNSRWDDRNDSRWDDSSSDRDRWENRDDSRWSDRDNEDRDRWDSETRDRWEQHLNDGWFWQRHGDDRHSALPSGATRLELVSGTDDWVTVSIEGLQSERQLVFTDSNAPQAIDLAPGTYRISFRPAFGRSAWQSGYLNVGRTAQIRIQFDQARDRIQVYDDPYAWTSDAHSPIRLLTVDE